MISLVLLIVVIFLTTVFVHLNRTSLPVGRSRKTVKTLIIAGSGGHTAEILRLTSSLQLDIYTPRHYVVARTDEMSLDKINEMERKMDSSDYSIHKIPRSREVGQSWITSIFTTLYACIYSLPLVLRIKPDLLLCNGPGTCVPICIVGFFMKVIGIHNVVMVYVESMCRIYRLSLSANILQYFADNILVQWPNLVNERTLYIGRVV